MMVSPKVSREKREWLRNHRNLHPHKAAVVAMTLYNERYAAQRGGSMDFWDSLTDDERGTCEGIVRRIEEAPRA